ncbi:hypothetical protein [Verrucosispora sioxanthis]|uniref:hypothetical protein n=1 Tax=Verrucosispora sioxanthis TaxID=2499994 RepID=UPI001F2C1733|nr:hypothetical protein [Verrucosispora sioxanthis]
MEKTVLYQFLIEVPRAAAIWSVLLVLALGVLTVLVARPEPAGPVEKTTDQDAVRAATEEADLRRYAGEVAVAAAGAGQNAERRRTAWRVAQAELDRAWAAYDQAEAAARRLAGVTGLSAPRTPRTPAEYAARERWLHRAAMAAHWRGDLTARQLTDVLAHRSGWDPDVTRPSRRRSSPGWCATTVWPPIDRPPSGSVTCGGRRNWPPRRPAASPPRRTRPPSGSDRPDRPSPVEPPPGGPTWSRAGVRLGSAEIP